MTDFYSQLQAVKRFKVPNGISRRFNCPFCGGYNTLGVSNISGVLEWHCFRASCEAKGKADELGTVDSLKNRLNPNEKDIAMGADIPDVLLPISNPDHMDWLKSINSYLAWDSGLAEIKYSPELNRILFGVKRNNHIVGYSGRRLNSYGPKWVKYGDTSSLFTCGEGQNGVLVEDAPSACAVGVVEGYTGISLLGTTLTSQHKVELFKYDNLTICLDPDAASKSIELSKSLSAIRPTTVVFIPDDLKWYSPKQIKSILTKED